MIKGSTHSSNLPSQPTEDAATSMGSSAQSQTTGASVDKRDFDSSSKKGWEAEDGLQRGPTEQTNVLSATPGRQLELAAPDTNTRSNSFSLRPDLQRRGADPTQKGTRLSGISYQQMHINRAREQQPNTASSRVKEIIALREQSLTDSGIQKYAPVPRAERVNHMGNRRSMDTSIDELKKDPTLTSPPRPFPKGINRTDEKDLSYAQRPGPETRINSINKDQLGRALEKHGGKRLAKLAGAEKQAVINTLTAPGSDGRPRMTTDQAGKMLKTTMHSGGWEAPRSRKVMEVAISKTEKIKVKPVEVQATNLARKEIWNHGTKIITEARGISRGDDGYGHPQHNPEGRIVTYVTPSGRGFRYDQLNVDHVANTITHSGKKIISDVGQDLRTLRGFTNPIPFSQKSTEAEAQRNKRDAANLISKDAKEVARDRLKRLNLPDSEKVLMPKVDKTTSDRADVQMSNKGPKNTGEK